MAVCREHLTTTGNAKLDPVVPAGRLVTRWRLWLRASWKKEKVVT